MPNDVLVAIEHVKQCTGDPKAWLTGLTPQDATDVVTIFAASPQRLDGLLGRIRRQHPDLFNPTTGEMLFPSRPTGGVVSDHQEGDAAEAIRDAEAALAHQNSATAQLDLQVIDAVLNAHQKTAEGREALNGLQQDIEAAVRTRSDLDTPAGARDFQRFLVGKLRDIRAVVATASLDDTSKSALMAAWTSLYSAAKPGDEDTGERHPSIAGPAGSPATAVGQPRTAPPEPAMDPYPDPLLGDDPGLLPEDMPAQTAPTAGPAAMPSIPSFGGGAVPGGTALPGAMPTGFPLPGPLSGAEPRSPREPDDALLESEDPRDRPSSDTESDDPPDHEDTEPQAASGQLPASGPTTITLPNGETVTAADPQLAEAIQAAARGAPIADAFRQQGITIPPPGTAVTDPVDPSRVVPGDIGMFTDRHALALGDSRALLNGQIQHISTVSGPSFLGWEHPPAQVAAVAPARTDPPAPTRPASTGRP